MSEKQWFQGLNVEEWQRSWSLFHKDVPRKTLAPYWVIVAILCGIAAALLSVRLS